MSCTQCLMGCAHESHNDSASLQRTLIASTSAVAYRASQILLLTTIISPPTPTITAPIWHIVWGGTYESASWSPQHVSYRGLCRGGGAGDFGSQYYYYYYYYHYRYYYYYYYHFFRTVISIYFVYVIIIIIIILRAPLSFCSSRPESPRHEYLMDDEEPDSDDPAIYIYIYIYRYCYIYIYIYTYVHNKQWDKLYDMRGQKTHCKLLRMRSSFSSAPSHGACS